MSARYPRYSRSHRVHRRQHASPSKRTRRADRPGEEAQDHAEQAQADRAGAQEADRSWPRPRAIPSPNCSVPARASRRPGHDRRESQRKRPRAKLGQGRAEIPQPAATPPRPGPVAASSRSWLAAQIAAGPQARGLPDRTHRSGWRVATRVAAARFPLLAHHQLRDCAAATTGCRTATRHQRHRASRTASAASCPASTSCCCTRFITPRRRRCRAPA